MSSSSLFSTPSKHKSTLEVVESALQILDQVSELTLDDETLITGSLQQEQPLQLEQFQTPQARKRSLSFVVTPPRLHLKDCFSQEVKPEDACVMRGSLPFFQILPISTHRIETSLVGIGPFIRPWKVLPAFWTRNSWHSYSRVLEGYEHRA